MTARTPKSRTLGGALREARQERGLTLRELARRIGRDQGVLSRWETGDRTARPEHVAQILTVLGVRGDQYDDLVALAYRTDDPLWVATTLPAHRQQMMALLHCERNASKITEISPLLIPGLLQTSDYTRAIMESAGLGATEISTRVAVRAERQNIITKPDPVKYSVALFSYALTHLIGGKEVMIEQLRHLLEMTRLPNVEFRVVRGDSGWTPAHDGPFYLAEFARTPPVVHLENSRPVMFLHEQDDVKAYQRAAERVFNVSLCRERSIDLVAKALAGLAKA